jgi:hypothetical protein
MARDIPSPTTQLQADLEAVCRLAAEGKRVTDPELLARVRASAARVREDALEKFGVQDIGVQIIRELRDGE